MKKKDDVLMSKVVRELSNLQLAHEMKKVEHGIVDVPIFGIRFKTVPTTYIDDSEQLVVNVIEEEDVDMERFFVLLAARGYLHWLRKRVAPEIFLQILTYKKRWKTLVDEVMRRAIENKESPYIIKHIKSISDSNFKFLFMAEPGVLDWIVRS